MVWNDYLALLAIELISAINVTIHIGGKSRTLDYTIIPITTFIICVTVEWVIRNETSF